MTITCIWEANACQSKSLDTTIFLEGSTLVAAFFDLEFPLNETGKRIVETHEAHNALVNGQSMTNFRFFLTGIVYTKKHLHELTRCIALALTYHRNKHFGTAARWEMVENMLHRESSQQDHTMR